MSNLIQIKIDKITTLYSIHVAKGKLTHTKQREYIQNILSEIPETKLSGFAGFLKRSDFIRHAEINIWETTQPLHSFSISPTTIKAVKEAVRRSRAFSKRKEKLEIYIFPTNSAFIKKRMNGVSGYTPYKNCIHLYIETSLPAKKNVIMETLAHEFAHTISMRSHSWETLGDSIIFEGLAEHFRSAVIGDTVNTLHISKKFAPTVAMTHFVRQYMGKKDQKYYQKLFFDNKSFPVWTGYKFGYYVISTFEHIYKKNLLEIFKERPASILNGVIKKRYPLHK